jgi:hypothetical protein
LTQQGLEHQRLNIGNQDSGTLYLGRNVLIGSVADGCTSGSNLNGKSYNQTGAVLEGYLTVRLLRKLVIKNHVPLGQILPALEQELIFNLSKFLNILNPWKSERVEVIRNVLLSTLIFFVITEDDYLIANCGDGDILINGNHTSLDAHSGKYFAKNLVETQKMKDGVYTINPSLHFCSVVQGKTDDVDSLLIATDGFLDRDILKHYVFKRFFLDEIGENHSNGFQDRRLEFRKDFLAPLVDAKNGRIWPHDDATFISIQRVEKPNP